MGPEPAVAAVRRAVRALLTSVFPPFSRGGDGVSRGSKVERRVWVACSGGADSLALAAATAFVAPRLGLAAGLITVDHGLQDGSAAQAAAVATLAWQLGFDPVITVPVTVDGRGGPEAAARHARYAALARAAGGAPALLGHTLDDQAETVLLGLGRGSGARSIAGMRAVDGPWLRPLLGLRRSTTVSACRALGLTPWDDPHNTDPAFRRVRVRREALPLLEDVLGGGVAEALARTADLLRADADALDTWATSVLDRLCAASDRPDAAEPATGGAKPDGADLLCAASERVDAPDPATGGAHSGVDAAALADLPTAVRTRVLRQWADRLGAGPLTAERTAALDALITDWHGQAGVELPGGVRIVRASGRLTTCPS